MSEHVKPHSENSPLEQFFGVLIAPVTYKRLGYLLLAFPLGIAYFIFLVTGISTGLGLLIIWLGLPILLGVLLGSYAITAFERRMAIGLLDVEIPPMSRRQRPDAIVKRLMAMLGNPTVWKGLIFQFLKFPLGILSFVLVVSLVVTSVAFIFAPLLVVLVPGANVSLAWWTTGLSDMTEATILFGVGIFLLPASLHLLNGLAWVQGQLAKVMLGDEGVAFEPSPAERDVPQASAEHIAE